MFLLFATSRQCAQNAVDRCQSTYQFGQFFALNHTTFVSSIVLQETHTSCDEHSNLFSTRKTLINALSSEVCNGMFTQMTSTMT